MNRILISTYLLFFVFMGYGQKVEKKIIYLDFTKYKSRCVYNFPLKINIDEGIQFNLCAKAIFLYVKNADTLPINKLKNYKLSSLEEVEIIEKEWRKNNKKAMIKKFGKIYPWYNKNGIFDTYLIEIINDNQFVIYPVEWRGLDIIAN
jgi:hypothetical protein